MILPMQSPELDAWATGFPLMLLHAGLIVTLGVLAPAMLVWSIALPFAVAMALGSYLFYAQHNFPGARIQETYDLIDRDLCWHPGITNSTAFLEFVREVKERFQTL